MSPRLFLLCTAIAVITGVLSVSFFAFIARANVYNLYASTCLGGWGNTHLSAGAPQAVESNGVPVFTEANSARLDGSAHAQIYCGGFSGDISENAVPKKILVKFSWAVEYPTLDIETPKTNQESATSTDNTEEQNSKNESLEDSADNFSIQEQMAEPETVLPVPPEVIEPVESGPKSEQPQAEEPVSVPTPEPAPEPASEEPTASILDFFTTVAHAQELAETESATTTSSLSETATTTLDVATTTTGTSSYGLVEVLYTLNGVEWKSLGFVEKDEFGNKYFEIPIEEASEWEDISKIQIGVQSVPTVDGVAPVIYLDAIWLEVEYQTPWEDPYVPPGEKEGDIIIAEARYENNTAVLVSRKPELLIGNPTFELWLAYEDVIDMEQKKTSLATAAETLPEIDGVASSTITIEDVDASTTDIVLDSGATTTPASETIVADTTILPEQHSSKQWRFIAGDDQISHDTPRIAFFNGNIFWLGKENLTIWHFNPQTGAYSSASFNPGDSLEFYFLSEAGESRLLKADATGVLNSEDTPIKIENENQAFPE